MKGQVLQVMQGNAARDDVGLTMSLSAFDVVEKLRTYRNLIVEGVAGTGKSHLIGYLKSEARFADKPASVRVVVFHPATSYEDFVEGLRPQNNDFLPRDGVLLELCREVAESDQTWVLVIDEINRANTAKVLGDLLYAIEPSKRVAAGTAKAILAATDADPTDAADQPWTLLQLERRVPTGDGTFRQRFVVPDNLLILGTMNTTDRSVGTLDLALRRRFVVVRMQPMPPISLKDALQKKHEAIAARLEADIDEWNQLNEMLEKQIGPDALLGHSYFFDFAAAKARDDAAHDLSIWRDLLLPQLGEILVAFNAIDQIGELLGELKTGGWTLKQIGSKVDGYPIVVERKK
jgi:5-methylcytosine-specific restriction protein B